MGQTYASMIFRLCNYLKSTAKSYRRNLKYIRYTIYDQDILRKLIFFIALNNMTNIALFGPKNGFFS